MRRGRARSLTRFALLAALASACGTAPALAARDRVAAPAEYPAGTIVISKHERRLYLTLGDGTALRYPIAVGMSGKAWVGWAKVDGKIRGAGVGTARRGEARPSQPRLCTRRLAAQSHGARALTLDRDQIAIHGTTASMRKSVGSAASYGCIRMYNEDVVDLFDRVQVGANVVAVP